MTTIIPSAALDENERIKTQDIVIPTLIILAQAERQGMPLLSSGQVSKALEPLIVPSAEDKATTASDDASRFVRLIRNALASHDTLAKMGVTEKVRKHPTAVRVFNKITPKGKEMLFDHMMQALKTSTPDLKQFLFEEPELNIKDNKDRNRPNDIADVALFMLAQAQALSYGNAISIPLLRRAVKAQLPVDPKATEARPGRKMTRVDESIMASFRVLTKNRFARQTNDGLVLTVKGKVRLLDNHILPHLPSPVLVKDAEAPEIKATAKRRVKP